MFKKIIIFALLSIFLSIFAGAQENQEESNFFSYILAGSLNRTAPYLALEPGSVQELLNMVRPASGSPGWKNRAGTAKHNSTTLGAYEVKSLHAYYDKDSNTNYLFAQANDNIYSATNYPPTTGTTFGSSIYSMTASSGTAYSATVGNNIVFAASGSYPFFYSGTTYADGVYTSDSSADALRDIWEPTRNADTTDYAIFINQSTDYVYVISHKRLDTINLYFDTTVNATASSTASVYTRQGGAWAAVSGFSDGTSVGGVTFAQSGALTWTYSNNDEPYILPDTNMHGFIYRIGVDKNITDNIRLYQVTVAGDAQKITPLWDGMWMPVTGAMRLASGTVNFDDYLGDVTDGSEYSYIPMDGLTTVYVGYMQPVTAIYLQVVPALSNDATANTPTIYYWSGTGEAWTTVGTVDDSTTDGTNSLTRSGIMQWDGDNITEDKTNLGGQSLPMYWYKIVWSGAFPNTVADEDEVGIWEVAGAYKPNTILKKYDGVATYNGRAVFWPGEFYENGMDYTAEGKAWITQGVDAGMTGGIFGFGEVNAFIQLYSYGIVSTKNPPSLFVYEGKIPTKFDELRLTSSIGCVAPKTMLLIEDSVKLFNQNRTVHAVIFMAHDGVYLTDGQTVINISQEVADYWNLNSTYYIEPSYAHISYGWIDYDERTVHFAIPLHIAAGTQATCNYELVYNYLSGEWYDLHKRYLPMSSGISLVGSDNARYAYTGDYTGFVFRTGTGSTDWTNYFNAYLVTSDFNPYGKLTLSSKFRRISLKTKAQSSGDIDVYMYPDGKTSAVNPSGTANISMAQSGYGFIYGDGSAINLQGTIAESMAFKFDVGSAASETMEIYGFTIETQPVREAWE